MKELLFIGMGLYDENDISIRGLEELRKAKAIFMETYTSLMKGLNVENLVSLVGKEITPVSRKMIEEEDGERIISSAKRRKTAFLVPGDPLIATTHVDLRLRAEAAGVKTRIIHGASIISAAMGLTGLQNYKFGKSVSIPLISHYRSSDTPYRVIEVNKDLGLHTLCFLDIRAEENEYLTINDAIETLIKIEQRIQKGVITQDTLIVGVARAGSRSPVVRAGLLSEVLNYDFGSPPHIMIFPGKLHFKEAEALIEIANAPKIVKEY